MNLKRLVIHLLRTLKMAYEKPNFSINDFDSDGDMSEAGVYLHFGNARIRVADTKEEFTDFIKRLQSMEKEIYENY
jgi:hypothetical protein